ncbi:hypothetical protein [uncultured Roseibium sp.]|uniref:hypothetical protein n=1 Tax=uncultured Roseibium sp. TaxID=1936171 RepID=UPI002595B63D|nr:hypothetical protein [uncultured Roseibium sp.]
MEQFRKTNLGSIKVKSASELRNSLKYRTLLIQELAILMVENVKALAEWQASAPNTSANTLPDLQIYVICSLTVIEDLETTPAIGQLLKLGSPLLTLLVTLPTDDAIECFRTRAFRSDLHQTAMPILESNLKSVVSRLGDKSVLCFVPRHSVLTAGYARALENVMAGATEMDIDTNGIGVARAGAWLETDLDLARCLSPESLLQALQSRPARSRLAACWAKLRAIFNGETNITVLADELHSLSSDPLRKYLLYPAAEACSPQIADLYRSFFLNFGQRMQFTRESQVQVNNGHRKQTVANIQVDVLPPGTRSNEGILELYTDDTRHNSPARMTIKQELKIAAIAGDPGPTVPLSAVGPLPVQATAVLRTQHDVQRTDFQICIPPQNVTGDMVTCYVNRGGAGNPVIRAFADSLRCELRYAEDETGYRAGIPVVWGVLRGSDRIVQNARKNNQYFFYFDHAYFSRGHGKNYRIARNSYEAGAVRVCPGDRLDVLDIAVQPWRRGGSSILVCPPTEYFMKAHGCPNWLDETLMTLRHSTDREIVVRRKPKPGETVEPIEDAFRRSFALVTHSSNIAIEAAIAGVPVFVSGTSAAAPIGETDFSRIEMPVYPDRDAWLRHLAYNQYTMAEIADGTAWRMLLELETRPFA